MLNLLGGKIADIVEANIIKIFHYISKDKGWETDSFDVLIKCNKEDEIKIIVIKDNKELGALSKEQLTKILT